MAEIPGDVAGKVAVSKAEGEGDDAAPDTWESADIDEQLQKLHLKPTPSEKPKFEAEALIVADEPKSDESRQVKASNKGKDGNEASRKPSVDPTLVEKVDSFLREALRNPRDRLTSECRDPRGDYKHRRVVS